MSRGVDMYALRRLENVYEVYQQLYDVMNTNESQQVKQSFHNNSINVNPTNVRDYSGNTKSSSPHHHQQLVRR